MRIILTVTTFFFCSMALACNAIKPGYMGGGLIRTPAGARLTCGALYQAYVQKMDGQRVEMFLIDPGAVTRIGKSVGEALDRRGYIQFQSKKQGSGAVEAQILSYINLDTKDGIVVTIGHAGSQVFMSFLRP